MALEIKKHPTIGTNEVYIDGLMVGVFEQMNPDDDVYSFMSKCSHDKLTGDHYIEIGEHLNKLNKVYIDYSFINIDSIKPIDGSPVIAKTENNLLIPCFFIDNKFVKVNKKDGEFAPTCLVHAKYYRYELEQLEKLN